MSRDGSGSYTLPAGINPVVSGTTITDEWANQTLNDVAAALTQSLSKDGQTTPSADLPMGGRKHTGVADPTARSHYASLGVVQDNLQSRLSNVSGGNNITGNMSIGTLTSYSMGMGVVFTAVSSNNGAVTLNINGVGAKSLLSKTQNALVTGDILIGRTYMAYYNPDLGSGAGAFVLLTETSGSATSPAQIATTGWIRPDSGDYPAITFSGTNVTIPAGDGYIISPGTEVTPDSVSVVSWAGGTYALSNVTPSLVSAYTTLCINSAGQLVQLAGKPTGASLRNYIILGYVNHIDGTVYAAPSGAGDTHLSPEIWLDDGYQAKDTTNILQGVLISGGKITVNASTLKLDVASGSALLPGGTPNTPDAPNSIAITGGSAINFFPYHGTLPGNFAAATDTVDVTNYNPAAADSAPSAMTASNWTFHRLYWLLGKFILVYGQNQYASSTFSEAMSMLPYDESKYAPPLVLAGATYLGAILVQKATTSVDNGTTGAIICKGKETFGIGSSAGFTDAPSDGYDYGRKNAGWSKVLPEADPVAVGDVTLTEDGVGATASISIIKNGGGDYVKSVYDTVGDEYRVESYVSSVLDTTPITVDLADGSTHLLAGSTVAGVVIGNVTSNDSSVVDGSMVLFDGTGGATIKEGSVPGNVVTRDVKTSESDATAGRVLVNGAAYGLGGTDGLLVPVGTTAQRPGSPTEGQFRKNSTTGKMEVYVNAGWASIMDTSQVILPYNYLTGLTLTKGSNQVSVAAGRAMDSANAVAGYLNSAWTKLINGAWASGSGSAGLAVGGSPSNNTWYGVFLLIKADGSTEIGYDTSTTAANLVANVAVQNWNSSPPSPPAYRRIGWVYYTAGDIRDFVQVGDEFFWSSSEAITVSAAGSGTLTAQAPPNTTVKFNYAGASYSGTVNAYGYGLYWYTSSMSVPGTGSNWTFYAADWVYQSPAAKGAFIEKPLGSDSLLMYVVRDSAGNSFTPATGYIAYRSWVDTRGR